MKKRAGFVSNSSTASFVFLGFKIPENECHYDDEDQLNWRGQIIDEDDVMAGDGPPMVGKRIVYIYDDDPGFEEQNYTLKDLATMKLEIVEKYDLTPNDPEVKLHIGSTVC
jgi:hypothetical protein